MDMYLTFVFTQHQSGYWGTSETKRKPLRIRAQNETEARSAVSKRKDATGSTVGGDRLTWWLTDVITPEGRSLGVA